MHKLDRSKSNRPPCLVVYDWQTQNWDDLDSEHKKQIRRSLQSMQCQQVFDDLSDDNACVIVGLRCAYCECQIFYGGHIEHFRRKNRNHFPQFCFEWTNLFIACGSEEHCGHYKDRPSAPPYDPDQLIKPDQHNPDLFLYFYSSGEVRVRNRLGMTENERILGSETIRVFNLDCGFLNGARYRALKTYLDKNIGIMEALMEFDELDRETYISEEIESTKHEPFWTTVRHFFEKVQ